MEKDQQEDVVKNELTAEKVAEMKATFEERIPMLEKQLEYERLLTQIDSERHERWVKQMEKAFAFSQMQDDPGPQPEMPEQMKEEVGKKLKKA